MTFLIVFGGCTAHHQQPHQDSTPATIDSASSKSVHSDQSRLLRYYPPQGLILQCFARQNDELDQDSLHMRLQTDLYFTEVVDSVRADSSITLKFTYDSIAIEQRVWDKDSSNPHVLRYNWNNKAHRNDPQYATLTAAIGHPVHVTISTRGSIEEISGTRTIMRKILGSAIDSLPSQQLSAIDEQLKGELYGQLLAQQFLILPEQPIDSSGKWTRTVEQALPPLFIARATAQYTLQDMSWANVDSLLVIQTYLNGTIAAQPDASKAGVIVRSGVVKGQARGILSRKHGFITERHNVVIYDMRALVPGQSGTQRHIKQRKRSEFIFRVTDSRLVRR